MRRHRRAHRAARSPTRRKCRGRTERQQAAAGSDRLPAVAIRAGDGGLVARLVGRLDQLLERVGDLVVDVDVASRSASASAWLPVERDGLDRRGSFSF